MYGFTTVVKGSFEEVQGKVVAALMAEGFGVLTEIDVQATLKKKLDIDKRPYKILGACNPGLANQAIDAEADIGLLLPCNVVIREDESGDVVVGFMDPAVILGLVDNEGVAELGAQVREKLVRVKDSLL
jgi:uncharacterized protein (DUF302 family)